MVPQKNEDKQHDFTKDPIEAYIDGEWVTADGTTLGADNGIGVATGMAILLSKDIPHGPVEVLITATEETGMDGACPFFVISHSKRYPPQLVKRRHLVKS